MKFLDRVSEMARLMRLSDARTGGLVVLWGRRRIGKSELLKEWCRRANGLYTVADRSSSVVQRQNFASALATHLPGFDAVIYPTWRSLFDALSRAARAACWQGPLAIDEIPYWIEADETIVSVLQNWIDAEKRAGGLLVAIAGSSQHMMQGLVLDADSPIYGRADEKLKLRPIGIPYLREGLGVKSAQDAVKAYAVWGGVPRYWVAAERYRNDLDLALDELVLDPLGVFHEEPNTLLQSEIPSAISLKPCLDAIGLGANRMSEIAGRLGIPATTVSKPLARLVDLGFVKREIPYGENEKSSKKSLYRIADPFCRLWFKVVAPRRSVFDSAPAVVRNSLWRSYSAALYAAEWEELARNHVAVSARLSAFVGEGGFWLPAGRWWSGNSPELDVVSFDGTGRRALVGEVKWSEKPYSLTEVKRLAEDLRRRPIPSHFPSVSAYVLFLSAVASGMPKVVQGVHIVTAKDVCSQN